MDRAPTPARAAPATTATVRGTSIATRLMVRRRIAAGVGVVVLIVIVLLINGCLKSGKEEALKTYNREAGQLVQESDQQVAAPLFKALASASEQLAAGRGGAGQPATRAGAEQAAQAEQLSVPERNGRRPSATSRSRSTCAKKRWRRSRSLVRTALAGSQGKQASTEIAGAMEVLLASDVVYSQRVAPLIQQELAAGGVHGLSTASTQFLPNLGWLEPSTVKQRLTGKSSSTSQSGPIAPGTHGSALTGVSVGSTTLQPEANRHRQPPRARDPTRRSLWRSKTRAATPRPTWASKSR